MTVIPNNNPDNNLGFVQSTVNSVNSLQTVYLLFGLTVAILVCYQINPTEALEKMFIFCLGGFFTYINNAKE